MRTNITSNLTDNAWVERIGYLRQMVSDQYDTSTGTPEEFTEWLVTTDGEEFDDDDERIILREAQRIFQQAETKEE